MPKCRQSDSKLLQTAFELSEWSEHEFISVQHFVLKYPYSLVKKQNYVIRNIKLKISIERKNQKRKKSFKNGL